MSTKRTFTHFLTLCFMLSALETFGQGQYSRIDSIVQASIDQAHFEGTVLVADQGKVIYHRSSGQKDFDSEEGIENSTAFGIASITKMFTAIVILELVEEGKLNLEDNLATLLPALKIKKAKRITLHDLLLHISGLPNEDDSIYAEPVSPESFVTKTLKQPYTRYGDFNYANIDYVLLGLIIEAYDVQPWDEAVQERILKKANMMHTGFLKYGAYPEDFAYPSSFDDKGVKHKDPLFFIENFYAAGCMYSTAEDLLKLDRAMYSVDLLSEGSKEQMFTSYPAYNYSGYGVWTYNYPFVPSMPRVMERRGGIQGANSVIIRLLDLDKTIIILSNNNMFNPDSFGELSSLREALLIEMSNN